VIGINQDHPKNRQRFSIAHEVGHWCLHRSTSSVFVDTSSVFFRDKESSEGVRMQEIEANRFAAALLMPEQELRDAVGPAHLDPFDEVAFRRLAARFAVSIQALSIRLARLDLVAQ
jgi:Zn-dependent peptidase ImmA (M78 family)